MLLAICSIITSSSRLYAATEAKASTSSERALLEEFHRVGKGISSKKKQSKKQNQKQDAHSFSLTEHKELNERYLNLKKSYRALAENHKKAIDSFKNKLENHRKENQELKENHTKLKKENEKLLKKLDDYDETKVDKERAKELKKLQNENSVLQRRVESLRRVVSNLGNKEKSEKHSDSGKTRDKGKITIIENGRRGEKLDTSKKDFYDKAEEKLIKRLTFITEDNRKNKISISKAQAYVDEISKQKHYKRVAIVQFKKGYYAFSSKVTNAIKNRVSKLPKKSRLVLVGFADSGGNQKLNKNIARLRAEAVANVIETEGFKKDSISARYIGETKRFGVAKKAGANRCVEIWQIVK